MMSIGRPWLTYVLVALAAGSTFILGSGKSWADEDETVQSEDAMKHDDAIRSDQPAGRDSMQPAVEEPAKADSEDK